MPKITYSDTQVEAGAEQSVLESLEAAGFAIPYSCRSGICHSCIMQSEDNVPASAQQGLSENQKAQNYFLACCCYATEDMSVNLIGDTTKTKGTVVEKVLLNKDVLKLSIHVDFRWFPGQCTTLWYNDHQGRSYSIASRCQHERVVELHIKRHDQGLVSRWLHDELAVNDLLTLSAPVGNCFYTEDHHDKPLLMVATGTGLAPLYGVLLEALAQKHTGPIHLYAGAGEPEGLYYVDKLYELAQANQNLTYVPLVRRNAESNPHGQIQPMLVEQDVVDYVKQTHTELSGWKVFLCGSPEMIKQVQRHCFFQGAAVNDILVDAFTIEKPGQ